MRIGYACINTELAKAKVQVNRSMIRRTFDEKGLQYASALALLNIMDLEKITDWNIRHNISLYRMSSDMFPWMSEYEFEELQDFKEIENILQRIGKKVRQHDMRLTFHPGPFNVLATNTDKVLANTLNELRKHSKIMDLIGLPRSPFAKINIHVGGAYGNKETALQRFCEKFHLLEDNVKKRLTVENDDKANMYSVKDLLLIHEKIGIPVVFDYFHFLFNTGEMSEEEAFNAACDTWPEGITPIVHFSSSRKMFENPFAPPTAHADFIYKKVNTYGRDVDIMFEAKAKEKAVEKYLQQPQ